LLDEKVQFTMSLNRSRGRIVYSTDPEPETTPAPAKPSQPASAPKGQTVYVERDRKRRRGKTVTVVTGVPGNEDKLREVLKTLQKLCGAGGTVSEGEIEVQGDHRERVAEHLTSLGYKVKFKGG
jgi:translation initiation factor 1